MVASEHVVVTGASGLIGRRLVDLLVAADDVDRVVALDRRSGGAKGHPKLERRAADLARGSPVEDLTGASSIVHLPFAASSVPRRPGALETDATRNLLTAASAAEVSHVVLLSSATVYGAWPNNPVPITESAPLRPVPEFAYAVGHAEVEQLLVDWAAAKPGRTVAVLRPVTGLAEDGSSWLARALAEGAGVLAPEEDPPAQFVHLDDVASALDLARRRRLDGTYNVSPDGWIPGARIRALAGGKPRVRPPAWFTHWVANLRWRFQQGPIPPGLLPYMTYGWLVANDRLKAEGWLPRVTNEQAYVAGTESRWWQVLSPKRRQELALALSSLLSAAVVVTIVALVRGAVRRRRAQVRMGAPEDGFVSGGAS
jgi:nucleoside-diphosphate-sugar epimerase